MKKTAFTLVEIMIVVAILGIISAIVMPSFQNHVKKAKESAAKENLQLLRNAIQLYATQHNDIFPGYLLNNSSNVPNSDVFYAHIIRWFSNASGNLYGAKTANYPYGRYLSSIPTNPFNGKKTILVAVNPSDFPEPGNTYGWFYAAATGEIRIDSTGIDSEGINHYDY